VRRALLVGIDHYGGGPKDLKGCVADATAMTDILGRHSDGSRNWETKLVVGSPTSAPVSRDRLRGLIGELFANARGIDLLFFFAGHGAQTGWGAELVTRDASANSMGVSMNDLLTLANSSPASSVTLILDCCFSGDLGNAPGLQSDAVAESFRLGRALLSENVTIMAASRATEPSQEELGHGAFTRMLLDGLEGGASDHRGNITALSLYGHVSATFGSWRQRPLLKANLSEPVVLRVGPPWLDPDLLRDLPTHFPTADHRLQLTPAHEGDGRPLAPGDPGTPEQQLFDYLGRLRNANLVSTDQGKAHYWVAMESGFVYLTALGRYFWGLAKKELL
jgi:hypothetical protein